jgi:hypothetical protein
LIDVALDFLVKTLNSWLSSRTTPTTAGFGHLELNRVVDDGGKWVITKERIGVALINIEEERILKSHLPESTLVNGRNVNLQPELKINLHVLVAANFTRYEEALKYLSFVFTYFQAHPSFRQEEYPGLDSRISRLTAELQSLGYEQLNQIWGFVGAKQLPSAIYKVRMVAMQDREPMALAPPITAMALDGHRR